MPIGDRALSLLEDKADFLKLKKFLDLVPRFLRAEIDDLFIRIHSIPTIEEALLDICAELASRSDREKSIEEAKNLLTACFRQLGNNNSNSSTTSEILGRESGEGIRLLEELLELRKILESDKYGRPGWHGELLAMNPADCDRLILRFSNMNKSEADALALVARDLESPGLPELLWLMEHPDDGRNPLVDAQRRDHQHSMLMYETVNKQSGMSYKGYDPSKTSDFMPPPPHKIERLEVNAMGEDKRLRLEDGAISEVVFVDTLSEALSIRPFEPVKLDTTRMFEAKSRSEVYQFVIGHGHTASGATGDKQGEERKAALEAEAELMRAKGRWWRREADQRKLRLVKEQLHRIAVAAALRVRRTLEARAKQAAIRAERLAKAAITEERNGLVAYANKAADRVARITAATVGRESKERALMAQLNFFDIDDCTDEEIKGFRKSATSYRKSDWSSNDVPRNPHAASVTFGTTKDHDHSDEPIELKQWHADAISLDKRNEIRRRLKGRVERAAEKESFSKQIDNWKSSAKELDQGIEARKDKENRAHIEFLEARKAEKVAGAAQRVLMRVDALKRGEREAALEQEAADRLKAERLLEEKERERFGVEEARQRSIDDFWGIPTAWAYYKRLEEYKKKVWQARIADRRKRMVQVGNSTGEDDTETADIRTGSKEPWQRDWLEGTC
mmetsp:Transcript_19034/g.24831  ORF Transcript_19034/g.24831 Transcript_19034/m.24831 type:complete len:678 (+) Transcript_19034:98-2131(+)